jgi:hypothetical protein
LEALRANREQVNAPATGAEHLENHDSERKDALVAGLPLASPVISTGMAKDIPARTITGDGRPLENSVTLELTCLDS